MRQKALKKKLYLKKETVSHLNHLEMDDSRGGVDPALTTPIIVVSQYTDPAKGCNTDVTCRLCWYVKTEYPSCFSCQFC